MRLFDPKKGQGESHFSFQTTISKLKCPIHLENVKVKTWFIGKHIDEGTQWEPESIGIKNTLRGRYRWTSLG
jgi:hypothetical protein